MWPKSSTAARWCLLAFFREPVTLEGFCYHWVSRGGPGVTAQGELWRDWGQYGAGWEHPLLNSTSS